MPNWSETKWGSRAEISDCFFSWQAGADEGTPPAAPAALFQGEAEPEEKPKATPYVWSN